MYEGPLFLDLDISLNGSVIAFQIAFTCVAVQIVANATKQDQSDTQGLMQQGLWEDFLISYECRQSAQQYTWQRYEFYAHCFV